MLARHLFVLLSVSVSTGLKLLEVAAIKEKDGTRL